MDDRIFLTFILRQSEQEIVIEADLDGNKQYQDSRFIYTKAGRFAKKDILGDVKETLQR